MNIFLIGFRGSGKSSVAPRLAQRLGWEWVDTDQEIQERSGKSIAKIFEQEGESGFRAQEKSVIGELAQGRHQVIALGGGAVLDSENRKQFQRAGKTVWLTAPAEALWDRISKDNQSAATRPSLTNEEGLSEVKSVLDQRHALYAECADYRVDTVERTPEQIADEIADWWASVDNSP